MKPKVLATRELPPQAMRLLEESFDLSCNPHDRPLRRDELLGMVRGVDGLLPLLTDRIDAEVLDAAGPGLKVAANYAVGYNNIDVPAATARGVAVCNTPDVLTDTTADLAMALLLACARRLVEADAYTRAGRFKVWAPLLLVGADVHHKTLGVLGLGRIGQAMARRAGGFDMRVIYHGRRRAAPEVESACRARYVSLEALLKESDFISLHVPLTPETRRLIGPAELAAMKPGAFLINTTRGEVVDEAALTDALREGEIAGAGLDVYENEPEIYPGLTELNNVVLAPHIGSASLETRTGMGIMAARNLRAALIQGVRPPNCLNPEVYDRAAQ